MTKPIRSYVTDKLRLDVFPDEDAENPRDWECNYGRMWCWLTRNDHWGDVRDRELSPDDYDGWEELKAAIVENYKPAVILPVYMYQHSGTALSTKPFSCAWDSSQIGFIFTTEERIKANQGIETVSPELLAKVETWLEGEVEDYSTWCAGGGHCFILREIHPVDRDDEEGHGEVIHKCGNFLGFDDKESGLLDEAFGDEAKNAREL